MERLNTPISELEEYQIKELKEKMLNNILQLFDEEKVVVLNNDKKLLKEILKDLWYDI